MFAVSNLLFPQSKTIDPKGVYFPLDMVIVGLVVNEWSPPPDWKPQDPDIPPAPPDIPDVERLTISAIDLVVHQVTGVQIHRHNALTRLLTAATEENKVKKWWQFWKRRAVGL